MSPPVFASLPLLHVWHRRLIRFNRLLHKGKDVRSHLINAIGYYETLAPAPAEDGGAEERPSATSHAKVRSPRLPFSLSVAYLLSH